MKKACVNNNLLSKRAYLCSTAYYCYLKKTKKGIEW